MRLDVHLPTTVGGKVILNRYTDPEAEQNVLLEEIEVNFTRTATAKTLPHNSRASSAVLPTFDHCPSLQGLTNLKARGREVGLTDRRAL